MIVVVCLGRIVLELQLGPLHATATHYVLSLVTVVLMLITLAMVSK